MVVRSKEKCIVDKSGKAVSVILGIKAYRRLMTDIEELEAIRAYHAAKASGDEVIPFTQAVRETEQDHLLPLTSAPLSATIR